ncbi:MAG TPA: UDP-3-O-(3-hydroxymyristoyl)glucosamine N-acyltransferase [Alphaproteobacteria bacterium]|nr:UDP-3-O-(3-hydroxymyristoyl)glucosamine N-acyltransferase [Alphaproteobacteria bacterium]
MTDLRFFRPHGPFPLGRLAELSGAELAPGSHPDAMFDNVAPLDRAGPRDVSFLDNRKYVDAFSMAQAGACVVRPAYADRAPKGMQLLLSATPYKAFALIAQQFHPRPRPEAGFAAGSHVDTDAIIGEGSAVAAGAVVGAGARVGRNCVIEANAVIGPGVEIGDDCWIGACASVTHAILGNRVTIFPGARIGQDGFGFAMDQSGHVRIPQIGRVLIGDDVEVGANSTIDRGSGPDTVIGQGTMIDNLVQIGHNVQIGRGSVIVAMVGISGSTKIGDHVVIAGHSGIAGHLTIGDGARISAKSGVFRDVPAGAQLVGFPAVPTRQFFRQMTVLAKLAKERGSGEAE